MAKNFVPLYWAKEIQKSLKKALILSNWCDYTFDKEAKKGNRLKILGAVKPRVQKYESGKDLDVDNIGDNAQFLDIDQADAFCFGVDDIDEAQAQEGFINAEMEEAKDALAESADRFVGKLAAGADPSMTIKNVDVGALIDPLSPIDAAHLLLYNNDVSEKTELAADLTPAHIITIRKKLASLFTDNVEYVKRGALGKYSNTYLRMSNCLYNNGTYTLEMVRTKKAIAFANAIDKVKVSDNPKQFGDIVKGLHVYGAKITRPRELVVIEAKGTNKVA